MAVDYTCKIGKLRLLIHDIDENNFEYTDEEIECFLELNNCNLVLAAIMALQSLVCKYSAMDGGEYRLDTIQYREPKSRADKYIALLNQLKDSIKDGTNPMLVGMPKTYGIYRQDRQENKYRMRDGEIIPLDIDEETFDYIDLDPQYGPYYEG